MVLFPETYLTVSLKAWFFFIGSSYQFFPSKIIINFEVYEHLQTTAMLFVKRDTDIFSSFYYKGVRF